ncbi:sodium:solute symporter family protein [Phaeacidiphilus oryzae]|uniref:sodium:solute symporter family protein n=1 Tax=Phaeacidiphilus oryzae TaxID=348818 RepID=UPI00068BB600|nr:sodium:solute symporter family protein [Phaeacidiphilus oryzae]
MQGSPSHLAHGLTPLASTLRLDARPVDYALVAVYFVLVLGIGLLARRQVSSSLDFLLSGRSLPAWITGLAFMSANLGATELLGQSANGAQYGTQAFHYYWIGAIPAMVFLGLFMMPFYYGSKVRSVPEFLRRRFNPTTQRIQAILFSVANVLIAGVNLFAMALVVNTLLGWPLWAAIVGAGVVVLAYTLLGGLSAAIYNEVLQFFVIVAAMVPLTIVGLHRVGGWHGLTTKVAQLPQGHSTLHPFPGSELTGITNSSVSLIGVVLGLGFLTSFGYWTTNFAEVQRAFSASSPSAAARTPLIAAIPKALIALVIIIPGMIATVLVPEIAKLRSGANVSGVSYNDVVPLMLRDLLPNGFLGVALAGLLASFMAGVAANISSFNTVVSYDLMEGWIKPGKDDKYYLRAGRWATVIATLIAIGSAFLASGFSNLMDYIQTLFSFFNVPLFAIFMMGLLWKRMTGTAGWVSLITGTAGAVGVFILNQTGVTHFSGQGSSFVGGGVATVLALIVGIAVSYASKPKEERELVGLVRSLTPKAQREIPREPGWYRSPVLLSVVALVLCVAGYVVFQV